MQGTAWIKLLQTVPPAQHDNLLLVTNIGTEVAIQSILGLEEECLVVRGRMAGTDFGRVLFVPYDQINYMGFQKFIKEADFRVMFGDTLHPPAGAEPPAPVAAAPAPAAETPQENEESAPLPEPAPSPAAPEARPAPVSKSILLARLRQRLAQKPPNQ